MNSSFSPAKTPETFTSSLPINHLQQLVSHNTRNLVLRNERKQNTPVYSTLEAQSIPSSVKNKIEINMLLCLNFEPKSSPFSTRIRKRRTGTKKKKEAESEKKREINSSQSSFRKKERIEGGSVHLLSLLRPRKRAITGI